MPPKILVAVSQGVTTGLEISMKSEDTTQVGTLNIYKNWWYLSTTEFFWVHEISVETPKITVEDQKKDTTISGGTG